MKGVFRAHGNCFACLDIKDEVEEAWREVALRVHASNAPDLKQTGTLPKKAARSRPLSLIHCYSIRHFITTASHMLKVLNVKC